MPAKQLTRTRQRNPRGQGERLRDDIIEALTLATVNHLFAELIKRQDALTETGARARVLAGAMVYCEFGLASPAPSSPGPRSSRPCSPRSAPCSTRPPPKTFDPNERS